MNIKKIGFFALTLGLALALAAGQGRIQLRVSGCIRQATDTTYRQVYGTNAIYPEVRAALRVVAGLHLWVGVGYVDIKGKTTEMGDSTRLMELHGQAGLGYLLPLGSKLQLFVEGGALYLKNQEKAFGETSNGTALGYSADAGMVFRFSKNVGLTLGGGYLQAIEDRMGKTIDYGGARGTAGVQIAF